MIIQNNLPAMNAHRQMLSNNGQTSKSLEKLSSGYRINRAGDDAAGLAISEKMRAQIRGLGQAGRNAQDGISLIQTAEGALAESHKILQRMRELAVQSSNGIYDNPVDRQNLNKEVDRLKQELDRISTSTHFNGIKLLDGNLESVAQVESTKGVDSQVITDVGNITEGKKATQQEYGLDLATVGFELGKDVPGGTTYTITVQDGQGGDVTFTSNATAANSTIKTVDDISKLFNGIQNTASTAAAGGAQAAQYEISVVGTKLVIKDILTQTTPDINAVGTAAAAGTPYTGGLVPKGEKLNLNEAITIEAGAGLPGATQGNVGFINTGADLKGKLKEVVIGKQETAGTTAITKAAFEALNLRNGDVLNIQTRNSDGATPPVITIETHSLKFVESGANILGDATTTPPTLPTFTTIEDLISALNNINSVGIPAGTIGDVHAVGSNDTGIVLQNDVTGTFGKIILTVDSVAKSAETNITFADNVREGTTVTIGSKTYEFVSRKEDVTIGNEAVVVNGLAGNASLTKSQAAKAFNDFLNTQNMTGYTNSIGVQPGQDDHIVRIESLSKNSDAEIPKVDVRGGGLSFQIGANGNADQRVSLNITDSGSLGLGVGGLDIATIETANVAITALDGAINQISGTRADLGALQNRMEHTIANLGVTGENLQAAESRIRDVDMAKEMMTFTKSNILNQAAQAMLAQANMQPQGVLQLLK